MKVLQVTTVHNHWDNRIFFKISQSLSALGYDVHLYAPLPKKEISLRGSVKTHFFKREGNSFFARLMRQVELVKILFKNRKAIIHFHDPELLPLMLLYRLVNRRIVYDIHEDNVLSIEVRPQIPDALKPILKPLIKTLEFLSSRFHHLIIAERVYEKRFPHATPVLNALDFSVLDNSNVDKLDDVSSNPIYDGKINLIYTGSITIPRGFHNYIKLVESHENVTVTLVGKMSEELKQEVEDLDVDVKKRIILITDREGLPFSQICNVYKSRKWDFGLAIFPYSQHYANKELTKFFEYHYFRIPIIATNFAFWEELIVGNHLGYCVSPEEITKSGFIIDRPFEFRLNSEFIKCSSWEVQKNNLEALYENLR